MLNIECNISQVIFPRESGPKPESGYAIVRMTELKTGKTFTAKGVIPNASKGMMLTVSGDWRQDPKYGQFFRVESSIEKMPTEADGVEAYLASGLIDGIGPVLAERIVALFGNDTMKVFEKEPEKLLAVQGLGEKKLAVILQSWQNQQGMRDVMVFLKRYHVGNAIAAKIYKKYGASSIGVLRQNPYQLAKDIDGVGFLTADTIALNMKMPRDSEERACAAVLYELNEQAETAGNVFCERMTLIKDTLNLLNHELPEGQTAVRQGTVDIAVEKLLSRKDIVIEDNHPENVYLRYYYACEKEVAEKLSVLVYMSSKSKGKPDFEAIENKCGIRYAESQKEAISIASGNSVCVITGGPGTGKTTTMKGVIEDAVCRGERVLLAAPTGRAAKRLSETVGMKAATIHRLLEFSPDGSFARNEQTPLAGDLLVVDESSMIDINLMRSLLRAVPNGMRTVFVGDVDQLPSVGAGNVLHDLIGSGCIPTVRLTQIFRQAEQSAIVTNAHKINRGVIPDLSGGLYKGGPDFCFIDRGDNVVRTKSDIVELVSKVLPEMGYATDDIQVLSPMKIGELGITELNNSLQEALNPAGPFIKRGLTTFRRGDRVMRIARNDYTKGVFNGDMGVISNVDIEERTVDVFFDGNIVRFKGEDLDYLQLAYASTVHKSQGQEYPVVVMPVSTSHYVMLMRNLLYTAVTRAKNLCVLIGDSRAVAMMVKNDKIRHRNSNLEERLRGFRRQFLGEEREEELFGPEESAPLPTADDIEPAREEDGDLELALVNSGFEKEAATLGPLWERVRDERGKYNFRDRHGNYITKNWFDMAEPFQDGKASVCRGGGIYVIDTAGTVLEVLKEGREEVQAPTATFQQKIRR